MTERQQIHLNESETNQFISLFLANQRQIYRYIMTLCPHAADAEDLLQATAEVLWAKIDQFEPGTNFLAWANRIAHLKVLEHRRAQQSRETVLDVDVLERLAESAQSQAEALNAQQDALFDCIEQLRPADRQLIDLCYAPNAVVKDVAQQIGRPANSVYKSLGRIRRWLMECSQRAIGRQDLDQGFA